MDKTILPEPIFIAILFNDDREYIEQSRSGHYFKKVLDIPYKRKKYLTIGLSNHSISLSDRDASRQLRIADSLIIYDPFSAQAYFYQGLINGVLKNYKNSINAYTKTIELDPEFTFAYLNRSYIYYEMELFRYTEEVLNQEVTISWGKNDPQFKNKDANPLDFSNALQDIDKVIDLLSTSGIAYFNRATIKLALKNYIGAIDDYSKALELEPELGEAYFNRALTSLYLEKNLQACDDLGKAGELGVSESYKVINRYCYKK